MPLATSILKSFVSDIKRLSVNLLDFYLNQTPEEAADKILDLNPDSVGFSMYIWNRDFIEKTADIIKSEKNEIIIYAGGAEVTASAVQLTANSNFDHFIRGEGEVPFENLMHHFLQKSSQDIGKIIRQDHIKDLNIIPSPFLTGNLDVSLWEGVLWELSRGCPFNCAFCSESRGIEGVRYFNEDRIIKELQLFEDKKVEQIFVLDPTFNINKTRAMKILSLISEHAPYIHYTFEIRAELLDEELAEKFSEIHCSLQIGLQSADSKVLEKLNRTINKDKFTRKISFLNKFGAVFGLDLIYGLPEDTFAGFLSSLDFALLQIPNHLDIFRLSVFPGTELFDKAEDLKIEFEKKAPYSVIYTPDYSSEDLSKSSRIADAVDLFYNKGRSAGWLLSVTEILGINPSEFFTSFSNSLGKSEELKSDIFHIQNSFLKDIFARKNKSNFLPVALDLSQFHHLYGEALHAVSDYTEEAQQVYSGVSTVYKRNQLLKYGVFSYDVTLYSELGMIDIESFTHNNFSEDSYAVIFNNGYEILTMGVEKHLYDFITTLDGKKSIENILQIIDKKVDDIQDLIDFLVESTLIIAVE